MGACAAPQPSGGRVPSEQVRARIGVLGFAVAPAPAQADLTLPARGWAAGIAAGASDGWNLFWDVGSDSTADVAGILVFFAPLGLVAGAFYGPFGRMPAARIEQGELAIRESLEGLDWPLERELRAEVGGQTDVPVDSASNAPADCLLEVSDVEFGLTGRFSLDPALAPFVRLRVRLTTLPRRELLHEARYLVEGPARAFRDWSWHAGELSEEITRLRRSLVERVVEEVLLVCPPSDP